MNRMICTAAVLAVTFAFSWAAPAQPESTTDAPSWGPEILSDPQAYAQHLTQSIREGKFTQFYFAITKGSPVRQGVPDSLLWNSNRNTAQSRI